MKLKLAILAAFAMAALAGPGAALAHEEGGFPRTSPHPESALARGICIDFLQWGNSFQAGGAGWVRIDLRSISHC